MCIYIYSIFFLLVESLGIPLGPIVSFFEFPVIPTVGTLRIPVFPLKNGFWISCTPLPY